MRLNQSGINLIKSFEKCKLEAYPDPITGGIPWTIGWGATGKNIKQGTVWTQAQADNDLVKRLNALCKQLQSLIKVDLTDDQFSAIVSLVYNIGIGNFDKSTIHKLLNAGGINSVSCEFEKWDKVKGVEVEGLKTRRLAEKALFLS